MLAKQPSSRLFISLFHPFQSNYLQHKPTITKAQEQKKMSQYKKARKNGMKDSFYVKISHLSRPHSSAVDCFGEHSNYTHASLFSAFLFPHCTTTMENLQFRVQRPINTKDEFLLYFYTWISQEPIKFKWAPGSVRSLRIQFQENSPTVEKLSLVE